METLIKVFGGIVLTIGGVFFLIIFGTLFGGVAGWVIGMVFDQTIDALKVWASLEDVTDFQLGAMLGFVGGFFRASVSKSSA